MSGTRHLGLAALALSCGLTGGCSDPVKDAEDRYEIVKRTGDKIEICNEGRKLVQAYLAQKNEEKYRFQKLISDSECLAVEQGA